MSKGPETIRVGTLIRSGSTQKTDQGSDPNAQSRPHSIPPHGGDENVPNELAEASFPDGFGSRSKFDFQHSQKLLFGGGMARAVSD